MSQLDKFKQYTLDKSAPIPLYFQVKNLLGEMLHHGELSPGDMIPTEYELCEVFNISRTTIRQALAELVEEGIFFRVKGRGTFASQSKIHHNLTHARPHFENGVYSDGFIGSTKVLELKTLPATSEISTALKIPTGTDVISLKRLKYANDEPLVVSQTYLPYSLCKNIYTHDLNEESLSVILSDTIHTKLVNTAFTLVASTATKEDCELLGISKIIAVQIVYSTSYNNFDTPIEYSISRYRGDRNTFSIDQR